MKIKDLPKVDRPREKLEKYGPERLSGSKVTNEKVEKIIDSEKTKKEKSDN